MLATGTANRNNTNARTHTYTYVSARAHTQEKCMHAYMLKLKRNAVTLDSQRSEWDQPASAGPSLEVTVMETTRKP